MWETEASGMQGQWATATEEGAVGEGKQKEAAGIKNCCEIR